MAEAIVAFVLQKLIHMAEQQIMKEVLLVSGVKDQVLRLTDNLRAIRAVLADAEIRQLKEEAIRVWLADLKTISYDVDDVLDEWTMMEVQVQGSEGNACSFPCFPLSLAQVSFRRQIASKITALNDRLDDIAGRRHSYNLVSSAAGGTDQRIQRTETISEIDMSEVKGRDQDKDAIIKMLLGEGCSSSSSSDDCGDEPPKPHVISIVGMGGIGKTTLAQLVYNDGEVKDYFPDGRIWVCVSDPFDEIKIAKAILESLKGGSNFGGLQLETMVQEIKNHMNGKVFLLVLDDVWNEDPDKWDPLRRTLMCGSPKSKILVTTRSEKVATIMGCANSNVFQPGTLSDEECWSIFSKVAFFGRSKRDRETVQQIGRDIAKKSKGLPLAAKTLGGLLRFRESREEWQSVLESELWQLQDVEIERYLFAPLWLSCYDLSPSLRQCLLYCAVFPKDHSIEKDKLVRIWMAHGYLQETDTKGMEMVGTEYFRNLCVRSFFQNFGKDADGAITKCKMHDIVHDFVRFLAKKECFSLKIHDSIPGGALGRLGSNNQELRHSFVAVAERGGPLPNWLYNQNKLRSLSIYGDYDTEIPLNLPRIFTQLTCLRSLELSHCQIRTIPSTIAKLKHLRYLDLSWNTELRELPETFCDLRNLEILILEGCSDQLRLPRGFEKLNLRILVYRGSRRNGRAR